MKERGFTLLEVLVATVIMAVAVSGILSALSTSMRNAGHLTDYDRAAIFARRKMDELLAQRILPKLRVIEGRYDPRMAGGRDTGWRARVTPFEVPANPAPGQPYMERIELEIWWMSGDRRRTFALDSMRRGTITPQDIEAGLLQQR